MTSQQPVRSPRQAGDVAWSCGAQGWATAAWGRAGRRATPHVTQKGVPCKTYELFLEISIYDFQTAVGRDRGSETAVLGISVVNSQVVCCFYIKEVASNVKLMSCDLAEFIHSRFFCGFCRTFYVNSQAV